MGDCLFWTRLYTFPRCVTDVLDSPSALSCMPIKQVSLSSDSHSICQAILNCFREEKGFSHHFSFISDNLYTIGPSKVRYTYMKETFSMKSK